MDNETFGELRSVREELMRAKGQYEVGSLLRKMYDILRWMKAPDEVKKEIEEQYFLPALFSTEGFYKPLAQPRHKITLTYHPGLGTILLVFRESQGQVPWLFERVELVPQGLRWMASVYDYDTVAEAALHLPIVDRWFNDLYRRTSGWEHTEELFYDNVKQGEMFLTPGGQAGVHIGVDPTGVIWNVWMSGRGEDWDWEATEEKAKASAALFNERYRKGQKLHYTQLRRRLRRI